MSTPRPKPVAPDWTPGDTLELVGYFGVVTTATVVEKPNATTTKIRTSDTGATMLVSNTLLRKASS